MIGSKWQFRLESMPLGEALAFPLSEWRSGGHRIDLGLVLGVLLASGWCLAARIPWRPAADALAVAASALIPVGRVGCMLFGCCMGVPCGHGAPFCLRFPPGSEAYNQQVRDGLIPLSAAMSLPAHPLPAYFAAASLLTLGVLVWLLRRGAPAGSLFLAFCILRPAAKLALEPLRAVPSPSPLMTAIPAVVLSGALSTVAVLLVGRLARR
jgi:phosphatidylglycerol:prolipoprotein diacylglycerol transferase